MPALGMRKDCIEDTLVYAIARLREASADGHQALCPGV